MTDNQKIYQIFKGRELTWTVDDKWILHLRNPWIDVELDHKFCYNMVTQKYLYMDSGNFENGEVHYHLNQSSQIITNKEYNGDSDLLNKNYRKVVLTQLLSVDKY